MINIKSSMLKTSKNLQKREKLKKCAYDTVIQPIL